MVRTRPPLRVALSSTSPAAIDSKLYDIPGTW